MVNGREKELTSNVHGQNKESLQSYASVPSFVVIGGLHIEEEGIVQSVVEDHVSGESVVEAPEV
jgi:hypothetical protein